MQVGSKFKYDMLVNSIYISIYIVLIVVGYLV